MKRIQGKQSGQSLVELAISVMIIMLLVLGAVETGMAIFQYVTISDAAQEGANFASIYPPQTPIAENNIKNRVYEAANDVLPSLASQGIVSYVINDYNKDGLCDTDCLKLCEGTTVIGQAHSITITVQYDHKIIFPLYPSAKPITLKASATSTILSPHCT